MTRLQAGHATVTLRRGRGSDLDALVALEREIFDSARFAGHLISRPSFRRLLASPSATVIVAAHGGQLSAYMLMLYRSNSKFARMYSIGVAPHARRRGVARTLLGAAEKDAVSRGRSGMRLEVLADDRGAIAFYETSGYRRSGHHPGYYRDRVDALRFEKALAKEPERRS